MERQLRGRSEGLRLTLRGLAPIALALGACVAQAPPEPAPVLEDEPSPVAEVARPDLPDDPPVAQARVEPEVASRELPPLEDTTAAVEESTAPSDLPEAVAASAGAVDPEGAALEDQEPLADPVRHDIGMLLRLFYNAYNARDWAKAESCFWPNATITEVAEPEVGAAPKVLVVPAPRFFKELQQRSEGTPAGFNGGLANEPAFRFAGNLSQAWCHYVGSFGGPEETMKWHRFDAFTFVLHNGHWRIAALVQSLSFDAE